MEEATSEALDASYRRAQEIAAEAGQTMATVTAIGGWTLPPQAVAEGSSIKRLSRLPPDLRSWCAEAISPANSAVKATPMPASAIQILVISVTPVLNSQIPTRAGPQG